MALSKKLGTLRPSWPPSRRRPSELIAILAHKGGGRPQPDADFAIGADKRAFGGNAPDDIFGGKRPTGALASEMRSALAMVQTVA